MYVKAIVAFAVCVGVVAMLDGCGDGHGMTTEGDKSARGPGIAVRERDIKLSSPILTSDEMLPDGFTCDPRSVWLPLRWSGVPDMAKELVLYGARVRHETVGNAGVATIVSAVLIGGLLPTRNKLAAGPIPDGAFFVTGLRPEALCLPAKPGEELTFQLYALASDQRFDRSTPLGAEEVLKRFDKALAVGSIFAPFRSPSGR